MQIENRFDSESFPLSLLFNSRFLATTAANATAAAATAAPSFTLLFFNFIVLWLYRKRYLYERWNDVFFVRSFSLFLSTILSLEIV